MHRKKIADTPKTNAFRIGTSNQNKFPLNVTGMPVEEHDSGQVQLVYLGDNDIVLNKTCRDLETQ